MKRGKGSVERREPRQERRADKTDGAETPDSDAVEQENLQRRSYVLSE